MKLFWPMAIVIDNGKEEKMFSYGGLPTVDKALKNIETWNEIYWVRKAWIDVTDTQDDNFKDVLSVKWGKVENAHLEEEVDHD